MSFKIENRSFSDMIDIFLLVMRKPDATFYQFIRSNFECKMIFVEKDLNSRRSCDLNFCVQSFPQHIKYL